MKKYLRDFISQIKNRPLVKDTITTSVLSIIGKGVGFLIPFFIARWFGISNYTDAFFFAYGVILFLSITVAPAIENTVVPLISQLINKKEDVGSFVSRVIIFLIPILLLFTCVFIILARPILSMITKFDTESLNLIIRLMIELSPLAVLLVISSILAGSMNTYKKFATPALSPAFRAIINLLIIFLFKDSWGVYSIARGYVIGEIFRICILLWSIRKHHLFSWRFSFKFSDDLKELFIITLYPVLGMVAVGLNPIIDQTMATWLGPTKVSVLSYADRLYTIPVTFLSSGVIVTLLSHWSERYQKHGAVRLSIDVNKAIKFILLASSILTAGLLLFSKIIVYLVYGRGALTPHVLNQINLTFVCYLFGLVPYILARVVIRALVVLKKLHFLMIVGVLRNVCNIVFNYMFMKRLGVAGIALSTSFVTLIEYVLLKQYFNKIIVRNSEST